MFALSAMAVSVNIEYDPIEPSTGPIVPGEWNENLDAGKAYAEANNVPMLAIYGTHDCANCRLLQTACNTDIFKEWAAKKQMVMVFNTTRAAQNFCRPSNSSIKPFVCIYWPKTADLTVKEAFTGTMAAMPSQEGDTLEERLINSCDLYVGGYPQLVGFEYLEYTCNDEGARLEAEAGFTTYVDLPLYRESFMRGYPSTNRLTAVFRGQTIMDETIVWDVNALSMSARVAIPEGAEPGDEIAVSFFAQNGEDRGSVKIFVVEPQENSSKNPLFVGERTAETLGYGEWTMDLDVAKAKYAAEPDSKLLVLFGGALWCPDCVMLDVHLLDRAEFKEWALANNVILVNIDVPNNPHEPDGRPCLLTRVVYEASDNYRTGRGSITDESEYQEAYQSGAGYLSRHMVSDEAAAAVYARNKELATKNWKAGGWNFPERANQDRPGVPSLYTLSRSGELAGCFDAFSAVAPRSYNPAYLKRLDELIALADGGRLLDTSWQTTSLSYDGENASGVSETLSAVDMADAWALSPVASGAAQQTITVTGGDPSVVVTVDIVSVSSRGAPTTVATAKGALSAGVSVACTMTPGEAYYVVVTGASEGTLSPESASADTKVPYTIRGTREVIANPYSNDWITTPLKATLPLYSADGASLAGFMELQLKKTGKLSVKISNGKARIATLSGIWSDEIAADGTATALLEGKGLSVSLTMTADGAISASVTGSATMTSGKCALAADYGDFAGNYAVTLPLVNASGAYCGAAYMTLSMGADKASKARGKMKYKVFLPDGKKLSGTTGVTGRDANFGIVPIAKTSGVNSFTASLLVRRNGGTAATRRAVIAADGVRALWTNEGVVRECAVFGSFINKSDSLLELSDTDHVTLRFDAQAMDFSEKYGSFTGAAYEGGVVNISSGTMALAESVKGVTFKLNRATGIFQGKTALAFTGKEKVSAKFSGVILPDWYSDCQCQEDEDTVVPMVFLPFGGGQCTFSDYVNGKRVKRSVDVTLE